MPEAEPLTLKHPKVQTARNRFLKGASRQKIRLSFEQLFEYFKADCIRIEAIAQEAGVTRQAIDAVYRRYFFDLFGKAGVERLKTCTYEKGLVKKIQYQASLFSGPLFGRLVDQMKMAGCSVEAVPLHGSGGHIIGVSKKSLLINGMLCTVHCAKKTSLMGSRFYGRCQISGNFSGAQAIIFRSELEDFEHRTFVVPAALLREKLFASSEKSKNVYLPAVKTEKAPGNAGLIDYWQYENAWHLIKPKDDPPAP